MEYQQTSKTYKKNRPIDRQTLAKSVLPTRAPISPLLQLQRALGNLAFQHMLSAGVIQAKLKVPEQRSINEQQAEQRSETVLRRQSVSSIADIPEPRPPALRDSESASACPIKSEGTLSEVSWGETSGIYPIKSYLYQPAKWDQAKTCELLKARGAIQEVGSRGESVHKAKPGSGKIEQILKPYHFTENFPAVDSEIKDAGVKWFYLSSTENKPDVHPGTTGTERVKTYGSFYNSGGGDVAVGDVYIHFYRLKPKASQTTA